MTKSNFALRLQPSLKAEVERLAKAEGASINQFINVAVAEKLSALATEDFFRGRAAKGGSLEDLFSFLDHAGNEPPVAGDEIV